MKPKLLAQCVLTHVILVCSTLAAAQTYQVGPGMAYTTLASLPALSPGDTVEIYSGTYNEVKRWTDSGTAAAPITIRGMGATQPVIDGTGFTIDGSLPNPRAVFQTEGSYITIENVALTNGRNGQNGAGVRVTTFGSTAIGVTFRNCKITNCDMGVMSDSCDNVLIDKCEIAFCGTPSYDGYSHNFYLGGNKNTLQFCYIHDSQNGQNVKSRAHYTELLYNYIADSQDGEIGLVDETVTTTPDSNAVLIGNIIISKPRLAGYNSGRFIQFGQDSGNSHTGICYVFNNTFVAGDSRIAFLSENATGASIVADNNIFYGSPNMGNGTISGTNNWTPTGMSVPAGFSAANGSDPGFVNAGTRDFHLTSTSPCINVGTSSLTYVDGAGVSHAGAPTFEYVSPLNSAARSSDGQLDIGAYEYVSATVPNVPTNLAATATSSTQINLTWTDAANNETGFKIERKTGASGTYAQIATTAANAVSYSDPGLSPSTQYYYRIRATNSAGDSAYSNEANATTQAAPPPPPNAPTNLAAVAASSTQINLTWTDASNNETGFKIERKTGASGMYAQIATTAANVVSYSDTGLSPSTQYYYRIRATNSAGDSAYSNEANATTQAATLSPPNAPTSLTAVTTSSTQINLTWTDASNNETGFKIERKIGASGTYAQIVTMAANVTNYSDTGLSPTTQYYYRIRATNAAGDSAYSNEANDTTQAPPPPPPPPPNAPTALIAAGASSTTIALSWTDNSTDETGFEIQRSADNQTFTTLASVGANTTAYNDDNLPMATTFYYRVRAISASGASAFSNVASATTMSSDGSGGGGGNPPVAISINKLAGSMVFGTTGKDTCSINGVLPGLPARIDLNGKMISLNVGGAIVTWTLNSKGTGHSNNGTIALKLKPSKFNKATKQKEFLGGDVAFSARMLNGTWSGSWADEGANPNLDAKNQPFKINVTVSLNGQLYIATVNASYSAKKGKSGKFKR